MNDEVAYDMVYKNKFELLKVLDPDGEGMNDALLDVYWGEYLSYA